MCIMYYRDIDMGIEVEIFRKVNRIKFILKDGKRYKDFLLKFFFRLKDMKNDILDNNSSNLFNEIYFISKGIEEKCEDMNEPIFFFFFFFIQFPSYLVQTIYLLR